MPKAWYCKILAVCLYNNYSKIVKKMKIPEELLKKWSELRSHGDGVKIAEQNSDVTVFDVSKAINTKECPDRVFEAIANFYKEKEEKVKEFL